MTTADVQFFAITVGILAGIFLNSRALGRMEDRMNARFRAIETRFNALEARIDRILAELGTFHSIQGEHKAKIDALARKQGL